MPWLADFLVPPETVVQELIHSIELEKGYFQGNIATERPMASDVDHQMPLCDASKIGGSASIENSVEVNLKDGESDQIQSNIEHGCFNYMKALAQDNLTSPGSHASNLRTVSHLAETFGVTVHWRHDTQTLLRLPNERTYPAGIEIPFSASSAKIVIVDGDRNRRLRLLEQELPCYGPREQLASF